MRKPFLLVVALLSLTACNKKPKLDGKIVGRKPGEASIVLVHAKATKGSKVWCSSGGLPCDPVTIPATGEVDIPVDLSKGEHDTPKKVMLTATFNDKNEEKVPLDLVAALPPVLDVGPGGGWINCLPRECIGNVDVVASTASVFVPAGSTLEIGGTKLAEKGGKAEGPIAVTPSPKELSLAKVCGSESSTLGTLPVAMTFADQKKATGSLSFSVDDVRAKLLSATEAVKKGPVPFAWEKGGAAHKGKHAAILHRSSLCYAGGASDARVEDLRVIVFTEEKAKRSDTCRYAFDDGTKGTANITMHDDVATAYDRTTGHVLGTKVFDAKKDCDYEVTSKSRDLKDQDAYPDPKAIVAWAAALAR